VYAVGGVWVTCEVGLKGHRLFEVLELLPHPCTTQWERTHRETRCVSHEMSVSGADGV
jgi:hypothetical protein